MRWAPVRLSLALVAVALGVGGSAAPAPTTSYAIAFEIGDAEFYDGDSITVTELSGDRPALQVGGTYHVKGRYKIASRDEAKLLFSLTTVSPARSKLTQPGSQLPVTGGEGSFDLVQTIDERGYLHVTLYSTEGWPFGGVYFGHGDWLLKKKGYSYRRLPHYPPATRSR